MNELSMSIVYNLYLRSVSLSRSDDCYRVYLLIALCNIVGIVIWLIIKPILYN